MKAFEIKKLISSNDVLEKAYKQFRKKYPYNKVVDMWEMCHCSKPIEEAIIEYIDCIGNVRQYEFVEEL